MWKHVDFSLSCVNEVFVCVGFYCTYSNIDWWSQLTMEQRITGMIYCINITGVLLLVCYYILYLHALYLSVL